MLKAKNEEAWKVLCDAKVVFTAQRCGHGHMTLGLREEMACAEEQWLDNFRGQGGAKDPQLAAKVDALADEWAKRVGAWELAYTVLAPVLQKTLLDRYKLARDAANMIAAKYREANELLSGTVRQAGIDG